MAEDGSTCRCWNGNVAFIIVPTGKSVVPYRMSNRFEGLVIDEGLVAHLAEQHEQDQDGRGTIQALSTV